MAIASAPGGIFLFGEHAVVYGYSAFAAAVDKRVEVRVERSPNGVIKIDSRGFGKLSGEIFRSRAGWRIRAKEGEAKKFSYVLKLIELTFNELGAADGLNVWINSTIPIGSGVSSSSALGVATVAATSATFGRGVPPERALELAFRAELAIQGYASKTGVGLATHGGFVKVCRGEVRSLRGLPKMQVPIGDTGERSLTGTMVRKVAKLRRDHPVLVGSIFEAIGRVADAGIEAFRKRDLERVGALMNLNQASLAALGVSSPKLERLIAAARSAGAFGAKLTGGGGGGCMIAIAPDVGPVVRAIRRAGGKPILTEIGGEGLRLKAGEG